MVTNGKRSGGGRGKENEERDGRKGGLPEWLRWCEVWFDTARRRRRPGSPRTGVGIRRLWRRRDIPSTGSWTGSGRAPFGKLRAGSLASSGRDFGDGGMTGMCSVGRGNVFSFLPNVFSFRAKVFAFRPNVFTLAGEVFSCRRYALVGDGAWKEGESPIRQAQGRFLRQAQDEPLRQAQDRFSGTRDDGDVSTRSGRCVQFWARCVNFSAECVQFRGQCVHSGGPCVQFSAARVPSVWGCRCGTAGSGTGRGGKARSLGDPPEVREGGCGVRWGWGCWQ